MPKNRHQKRQRATRHTDAVDSAKPARTIRLTTPFFTAGLLILAIGLTATGILSLSYLPNFQPPGCAIDSPCAAAQQSPFSKIPGIGWPVAYLGFAFVIAMIVAWITSYIRGLGQMMVWLARAGALVSLGYMGLIFYQLTQGNNLLCAWCITSHIANFLFLAIVEFAIRQRSTSPTPGKPVAVPIIAGAAMGFLLASGATGFIHSRSAEIRDKQDRAEADESTQRIIDETRRRQTAENSGSANIDTTPGDSDIAPGTGKLDPRATVRVPFDFPLEASRTDDQGFTGRYRLGDADAPIRLVIFSSYTCTHCRAIEQQVIDILRKRSDVSFTHKHVTMSKPCNPDGVAPERNNDCWASRAAEAAGILAGPDGFWAMHMWLFSQAGSFTNDSLPLQLRSMGFDVQQFIRTMSSNEVLNLVQQDMQQALDLGIAETPMIFINGVEFRGFRSPGALTRAVEQLAATNPPRALPTTDRPADAFAKYLEDWRQEAVRTIRFTDAFESRRGEADSPAQIIAWIDYQNENAQKFENILRPILTSRDDVTVVYRHFPVNTTCNSTPRIRDASPLGCRLAAGVEAAGVLGGADAYWAMHDFVIANQGGFTEQNIDAVLADTAQTIGLDRAEFLATMDSPAVTDAIQQDIRAFNATGINPSLLTVLVNGRQLSRWFIEEHPVLETAIDEAAEEAAAGSIP